MLADRIIPIISYTEEVTASFSSEKKKIPNTIGIFKYNSRSKKGSRFLFLFSSSVYFSSLFLTIISRSGIKTNVKTTAR